MNQIIVGMGEALWDVLPEGKKIGGAPANFAYHVSQFGFDSRVVSAIGDDKLGNEILENFDGKNLKYQIEKVPYPTGTVQVELDPNGVPMYDIKEGVAWDNIPFTPALEELAKNTRSVCFGSLAQRSVVSRETINRFLDVMPEGEGQLKDAGFTKQNSIKTKDIVDFLVAIPELKSVAMRLYHYFKYFSQYEHFSENGQGDVLASMEKDGNDNIHLPSAIRALGVGMEEVMKNRLSKMNK